MTTSIRNIGLAIILSLFLIPQTLLAASAPTLSTKQKQFISTMVPAIQKANQAVISDRTRIETLRTQWQKKPILSAADKSWLSDMAAKYKLEKSEFDQETQWQTLLTHVDKIPTSLALAQMITESGWGTSRFAVKENNYFGRLCFVKGCGMVQKRRPKGAKYEMKRFPSTAAAIEDYLHNINSNTAYKPLWQVRAKLREQKKSLDGVTVAKGLIKYSTRRQKYVSQIQGTITKFHLEQYNLKG